MRAMLGTAREQWTVDTAVALNQIAEFAMSLRNALGEVSRDEAMAALKQYAHERIDALR